MPLPRTSRTSMRREGPVNDSLHLVGPLLQFFFTDYLVKQRRVSLQTVGTINPLGPFTPPDVATTMTATITATSGQDGTTSGSTTITVYPPTNLCPPRFH